MEKYIVDKKEVIKSNNLIESSYKLTATEQKIIHFGASALNKIMISNDLTASDVSKLIHNAQFPLLTVNACDFQKVYNIKTGNVYKILEEASDRLYKRDLIYIEEGGKVVHKRWTITCKYDSNNARVELQFHPDLIRDLLIFKEKYTIFKLKDTTEIKSGYAYRLYELLKQYENFKMRIFSIEDLKFKLGIEDDEYEKYSSLKQNVITPSLKSINKTTDLFIDIEEIKEKRRVTKIKFIIKSKGKQISSNTQQISFLDNQNSDSDLVYKLQDILNFNITAGQAQKIINETFEAIEKYELDINALDYIKEKKQVVDNYNKTNEVRSYLGMIIKAIQNNWVSIFNNKSDMDTFSNYEQRPYTSEELANMQEQLRL